MLRVTKDRKLKYVSLGISLNPAHWDFSKNEPKADCPNREYIEMLIADKIKEYSALMIPFFLPCCHFVLQSRFLVVQCLDFVRA